MVRHVSEIPTNLGSAPQSGQCEPSPKFVGARVERETLPAANPSWRPSRPEDCDLLDNFWTHMSGLYPNRWASEYGDAPGGPSAQGWLVVLRDLSARQIRIGLRWCLNDTERWPPDPGRFRAIVFENDRPEHRALPRSRRLEVQPAEDSVRESHMASLKALVGMGPQTGEGGA